MTESNVQAKRRPIIRMTLPVSTVFLFVYKASSEVCGADIAKSIGMKTGTVYPILRRLKDAQMLESNWEEGDPSDLGRPLRCFYRIAEGEYVIGFALEAQQRVAAAGPAANDLIR